MLPSPSDANCEAEVTLSSACLSHCQLGSCVVATLLYRSDQAIFWVQQKSEIESFLVLLGL
jgi:hypothetical protein